MKVSEDHQLGKSVKVQTATRNSPESPVSRDWDFEEQLGSGSKSPSMAREMREEERKEDKRPRDPK